MSEHASYGSGSWFVTAGSEDAFVDTWRAFAEWTREEFDGLEWARLVRDETNPRHFVSFAHWRDDASRGAWMGHPDFQDRIGACVKLCDEVHTAPCQQVVSV